MKGLFEGYLWMWSAVARWHDGPLWVRLGFFLFYAGTDLVNVAWRPRAVGLAVGVLTVAAVLSPRPELTRTSGAHQDRETPASVGPEAEYRPAVSLRGEDGKPRVRIQLPPRLDDDLETRLVVRIRVTTGRYAPGSTHRIRLTGDGRPESS